LHIAHNTSFKDGPWETHIAPYKANIQEGAARKIFTNLWTGADTEFKEGKINKQKRFDLRKKAVTDYYKTMEPITDIEYGLSKKQHGAATPIEELFKKIGIKLNSGQVNKLLLIINEQNKARGGVSLIDDMAIIQKEGKAKGWKLNSFAAVLDFTDSMQAAGIKLPPAVTQAASRIIDIGGATLRGVGKVALVLDPIFMGFDEARAKRRGAGELDTIQYMGEAFVEGLVNLPTVVAGAAKWTKDKLTGEGKKAGPFDYLPTKPEFKSDILYTPKTFAQENLEKNLKDTSMDERVKNVEWDMYSAGKYKEPLIANPEYQEILESISREDIEKKLRHDDELSPYKNIDIEKEEEKLEAKKPKKFGIYADQIKNLKIS